MSRSYEYDISSATCARANLLVRILILSDSSELFGAFFANNFLIHFFESFIKGLYIFFLFVKFEWSENFNKNGLNVLTDLRALIKY